MAGVRRLRWLIRSSGAAVLIALLVVLALEGLPGDGGGDPAANAVMSYVGARRAGDATRACAQLSLPEQRELVARVSRTPPARASGRDCERHVLSASRWSELTRPALATFRVAGAEAKRFSSDVRLVKPSGFDRPILEVRRRDGDWKIDTQSAERSTFVAICRRDGAAEGQCECAFDRARARDPRVLNRRDGVMDLFRDLESGRRGWLLADLTRRCPLDRPSTPAVSARAAGGPDPAR